MHVFAVTLPEQCVDPAALNADSVPSADTVYTAPYATAGIPPMPDGVAAVQSGVHVFAVALVEQFLDPAASNAYSYDPHEPT